MENIDDILAKHFSGDKTPENERAVQAWKAENESEYAVLSEMWEEKIEYKVYDNKAAWNKIDHLIAEEKTKVFRLGSIVKFAAAASAALLIVWSATWFFSADEFLAFNNDTDAVQEYTLPDGSTIWLAPGSDLEYARDFETNRDLTLDGEAFFEVARDESHPFIIQTEFGEIEVLGTAFNVETNESSTVVSVEHGLVALRNDNEEVKLAIGQSAIATADDVSEIENADPNFQSWRTGAFVFDETPLNEVVIELIAHFGTEIIIESEKAKSEPLTAQFNNQSLEEIIEIIVLTCDVQSESIDDKIILK